MKPDDIHAAKTHTNPMNWDDAAGADGDAVVAASTGATTGVTSVGHWTRITPHMSTRRENLIITRK